MKINDSVFEQVKAAGARILVVTKYYDEVKTNDLIHTCEQKYSSIIFGYGENRVEGLAEKVECRIPNDEFRLSKGVLKRENCHFIGNLQTKQLKKIAKYCSVIHSLDSLKHAERLNNILGEREKGKGESALGVFLQVRLDRDKPTGIEPEDLGDFIEKMKAFENLEVVGISGMGRAMNNKQLAISNKKEEFQLLLDLRDRYLPGKLISAGTTQDYQIALDMGIDVVRVGKGILW